MLTSGLDILLDLRFYVLTPVITAMLILYGYLCTRLSSHMQIILTMFCSVVLTVCMCVVVGATSYIVVVDLMKSVHNDSLPRAYYMAFVLVGSFFYAALLHPKESWMLLHGICYLVLFPAMHVLLPVYALCNIIDQSWGTRDNQQAKLPKLSCFSKMKFRRRKRKNKYEVTSGDANVTHEDTEISEDQLKPMPDEEQQFWTNLVDKVIGKDVNLGLEKEVLANGLLTLRRRVLVVFLVANVVWMVGLGSLTFFTLEQSMNRSNYEILAILLYGFTFVVHITGMTVYKFGDFAHRIGTKILKDDKTHWVKQR